VTMTAAPALAVTNPAVLAIHVFQALAFRALEADDVPDALRRVV